MGEPANGSYVVNDNIKVKEFLDYWLEYDIRKRAQSSNTYDSYSSIVRNHINPVLGNKKLTGVNKGDVQRLYKDRAEYSKSVESKPYHTRDIDTAKTLNMEQVLALLEAGRDTPIHMQVLFNVLMGLGRQEINAVKYSDVDYVNRTLTVGRQLGKEPDREPGSMDAGARTKRELPLKTPSSYRVLPIPDYVFEAILEERKKYERWRRRRQSIFHDDGYICCSSYSGKSRSKDFHWRHYKELLKKTGLPDIRWHDLRSTYCTLLLKKNFTVSRLMGHTKELITMDVYGDNANIIPEEIPELLSYMDDVMPGKEKNETANGDNQADVSGIVVDMDEFLQNKKNS